MLASRGPGRSPRWCTGETFNFDMLVDVHGEEEEAVKYWATKFLVEPGLIERECSPTGYETR